MKDDKILESELNQNVDVGTAEDVEAVMKNMTESPIRVYGKASQGSSSVGVPYFFPCTASTLRCSVPRCRRCV